MANAGAMLDEGFLAEVRADTVKAEERGGVEELRPKPKEKSIFVDKRSEGMKHRTGWCAEADRYRCRRCGRGCKHMKMPGRCDGPNFLSKSLKNGQCAIWEDMDLVRRMDRQGEVLIWCRKCSGYARQRMGPQLVNCCMPEPMGTKEFGKMVKRITTLDEGRVPPKEAKNWRIEGEKKRITREAVKQFL